MSYEYDFSRGLSGNRSPQSPAGKVTERVLLYGEDINASRAPAHTTKDALVTFQSDDGSVFGMSKELLSRHLLLLGGIGSGKTNTVYFILQAILGQLTQDDLVLIFDSKGDFHKHFYKEWSSRHMVIGNHEAYEGISRCWNIFDEMRKANGRFDELAAKEIAKSLFAGRESQNQPFFSQAATDMVAKVLIHFARHKPASELNNASLVKFFREANAKKYHEMIDENPDFESARDYIGPRDGKLTPQALGVLSYITTMVNDVFIGIFGEHRNTGSFSMRQLVRQKGGQVVFIEYDLNRGEILGPIYGLLYDLALKEALGGRSHRGNVYLLCDELRILPPITHLNDGLNLGRSLGVKIIAGLQTINQLYDVYGEMRGKTIAAGFMNAMCFYCTDLDTRKYISERFGDNYTSLAFSTLHNATSAPREGHVVEDWDILNLKVGQAVVDLDKEKPFRFQFREYPKPKER